MQCGDMASFQVTVIFSSSPVGFTWKTRRLDFSACHCLAPTTLTDYDRPLFAHPPSGWHRRPLHMCFPSACHTLLVCLDHLHPLAINASGSSVISSSVMPSGTPVTKSPKR